MNRAELTIEELAQRLDVHVDIARRAAESLLANGLIEEAPPSSMIIDYCHCGAMGDDGHTFGCIMERMKRVPHSSASLPARGESDHG